MVAGRKPIPGKMHDLQGTRRADRHGDAGGIQVTIINPEPPAGMPDQAQKEWRRIAPILSGYKLLSDLDTTALEAYCRVYARWLTAEKELEKQESLVFRTTTGYQAQSAYLSIINQCLKQMQSLMAEFGMTPATGERLKAIANAPKQPGLFDDFLNSRKISAENGQSVQ